MQQPGREQESFPRLHLQNGLIRIAARQLCHGRSDDAGLRSRIVEDDQIRAFMDPDVVCAAQVVVRVAMGLVFRSLSILVDPASRDHERFIRDCQKLQNHLRGIQNTGAERLQSLELM